MIELYISIFSFWFAELSLIPITITDWLMNNDILYKTIDIGTGKTKIVFNKYSNDFKIQVKLLPFSCTKCLSFWICLVYSLNNYSILEAVLYAGVCSFYAILISKLFNYVR